MAPVLSYGGLKVGEAFLVLGATTVQRRKDVTVQHAVSRAKATTSLDIVGYFVLVAG